MRLKYYLGNLAKAVRAISGIDVQVAIWVAGLMASVNALRVSYMMGYLTCRNSDVFLNCINIYDRHGGSYAEHLNVQNLEITISLSIFTIGLLLRRHLGFLLSLAALFWIGKIYLWWRLSTLSFLRAAEIPDHSLLQGLKQQRLDFLLRDATWWDITVLTICLILLVWQARVLLSIVRSKL